MRLVAVLVVLGVVGCGGHKRTKDTPATESKPERVKRERPEPEKKTKPEKASQPEPEKPETIVSPAHLWNTYHANELQAKERFLNKPLRVVGIVDSVRVVNNNVHVTLGAGMGKKVVAKFKEKTGLADLNADDVVVIDGTGDGTVLGSPLLRDCKLRESGPSGAWDSLWAKWKGKD